MDIEKFGAFAGGTMNEYIREKTLVDIPRFARCGIINESSCGQKSLRETDQRLLNDVHEEEVL